MEKSADKYIETVGRRKTSVARVRLTPAAKNTFEINDKDLAGYFPIAEMQHLIKQPLMDGEVKDKYKVTAKIVGGGMH